MKVDGHAWPDVLMLRPYYQHYAIAAVYITPDPKAVQNDVYTVNNSIYCFVFYSVLNEDTCISSMFYECGVL